MQRLVSFYEKLPKGAAPEPVVTGPFSWYRKRYFNNGTSGARKPANIPHESETNADFASILAHHWILLDLRLFTGVLLPSE